MPPHPASPCLALPSLRRPARPTAPYRLSCVPAPPAVVLAVAQVYMYGKTVGSVGEKSAEKMQKIWLASLLLNIASVVLAVRIGQALLESTAAVCAHTAPFALHPSCAPKSCRPSPPTLCRSWRPWHGRSLPLCPESHTAPTPWAISGKAWRLWSLAFVRGSATLRVFPTLLPSDNAEHGLPPARVRRSPWLPSASSGCRCGAPRDQIAGLLSKVPCP